MQNTCCSRHHLSPAGLWGDLGASQREQLEWQLFTNRHETISMSSQLVALSVISSWLSAWLEGYKSLCSVLVFLFSVFWKSEVGPGWAGRATAPLGTPGRAMALSSLVYCLCHAGIVLMNVFTGIAVFCCWKLHPLSQTPNAGPLGEIINSMYLGSPQASQQMWLSEATAIYLI